jgi:hypothetical protein
MNLINYTLYIGGDVTSEQLKNAVGFIKCLGGKQCIIESTSVEEIVGYCKKNKTTLDYEGRSRDTILDEICEYLVKQEIDFDLSFLGGSSYCGENRRFRKGLSEPFVTYVDQQGFEVLTFDAIQEALDSLIGFSMKSMMHDMLLKDLKGLMGKHIEKLKPLTLSEACEVSND